MKVVSLPRKSEDVPAYRYWSGEKNQSIQDFITLRNSNNPILMSPSKNNKLIPRIKPFSFVNS